MTRDISRPGRVLALSLLLIIPVAQASAQSQSPSQPASPPAGGAAPGSGSQTQGNSSSGQTQKPTKPTAKAPSPPGAIHLESAPTAVNPNQQNQAPSRLHLEAPPVAKKPVPAAKPVQPTQVLIQAIRFRGNRRILSSTLRARIFSHPGDVYDPNALERDFMALWNTGYFDDIRLEAADGPHGKILTFFVREKKLIRSIDYKGMTSVSESDVMDRFRQEKVGLSIESQYDPVVIKRAEVVLEEMLAENGREFATVRARTRDIPPNSVALTFIVVEGPKVKLGRIQFTGNKTFSAATLIRTMKYSRPMGVPPWFYIFHRTYNKDKIDADLENIREFYQAHGYFFAVPSEPVTRTVSTHRPFPFIFLGHGRGKRVDVTIPIEEGDQYRLGRFVIRGNKLFKQAVLERVLPMKPGDVFNLTKVRDSIKNYTKLYGEFGYINFTAQPDIEPDRKKKIINLALDFDEEHQYFVHRINFSGNTKTRDKVIRREILLDEGSVFNTALWDLSIYRVNQLGFFSPIKKKDYTVTQNNQDHTVDIDLKVKEKGKNSIGFSGGVSGIQGNFVGANYSTNNFLGLGETLSLGGEVGTYMTNVSLGFTKPYLFDRPITTGFTVFVNDYHFDQLRQEALFSGYNPNALENTPFANTYYQNFQQNSKGFTAFLQYPLHRSFARVGLTYSYTISSIEAFSAASSSFFSALAYGQFAGPNQLTGITQSTVSPQYLYNTVNNPMRPTRGKYIAATMAFSGSVLGGNVNVIQPSLEMKYYHPINHQRNTLAFHFLATTITGYGGKVPPPFDRIYMGGEYDIRGFNIYSISPVIFFPTLGQVCNRDNNGNRIWAVGPNGNQEVGTCGSYTTFPYNTIQVPGGDSEILGNFEYRIPIVGPVTLAYFIDIGDAFILNSGQLKLQPGALASIGQEFPYFKKYLPTNHLNPIPSLNFRPRSSTGIELQVVLPVVHAPIKIYYGYNWLRLNNTMVTPPQDLPPLSMFPNVATYDAALPYFERVSFSEPHGMAGFTVAQSF
jgi:outer membrane protein insertion porin family